MVDIDKLSLIREHISNKASLLRDGNGTAGKFKERLTLVREIELIDNLLKAFSQLESNAEKIIEKYKYI